MSEEIAKSLLSAMLDMPSISDEMGKHIQDEFDKMRQQRDAYEKSQSLSTDPSEDSTDDFSAS